MTKRPVAIGLALCEQAIVEENARNITLVNCCTRLNVRAFPAASQRLAVFVTLIDGLGRGSFDLVVEHLDSLDEIHTQRREVEFKDSLQEVRLLFRLNECSIPRPGRYQVSLFADRELVTQRVFSVHQIGG